MDTLTLSQAHTSFEQTLYLASIVPIDYGASASEKQQAGPLAHQQRLNLVTLGNCLGQLDVLLADMEASGLDAIPAGAAVCERIHVERQKVVHGLTLYGARESEQLASRR